MFDTLCKAEEVVAFETTLKGYETIVRSVMTGTAFPDSLVGRLNVTGLTRDYCYYNFALSVLGIATGWGGDDVDTALVTGCASDPFLIGCVHSGDMEDLLIAFENCSGHIIPIAGVSRTVSGVGSYNTIFALLFAVIIFIINQFAMHIPSLFTLYQSVHSSITAPHRSRLLTTPFLSSSEKRQIP